MKNIYYLIWADSINRYKEFNPKDKGWKISVFNMNTFLNGLNLWAILLWLKYFKILSFNLLNIHLFPVESLNNLFTFIVVFASPFGVMNYFLIFYKNRHEKIIKRYSITDSKYFIIYSFSTVFITIFSLIFYNILS